MLINGVKIRATNFKPTRVELEAYAEYVREKVPDVESVTVTLNDDDTVDLDWTRRGVSFERIRRITGYLTGTLDTWNNAKQEEEKDRVKHEVRLK